MNNAILDEQFDVLRTKLEAAIEVPAVILVSSACQADGKSVTAHGLATSFSASGYRTVLVDANYFAPTTSEDRAPANLEQLASSGPRNFARSSPEGSFGTISFTKETLRTNATRPMLARAFQSLREAYDIVIMDAAVLCDSNLALMLAKHADGVVLTVRKGRSIKKADHELIKLLGAHDLPLLGTVTISAETIRSFKQLLQRRPHPVTSLPSVETPVRTRTAVG